jgi:hypothetical protein
VCAKLPGAIERDGKLFLKNAKIKNRKISKTKNAKTQINFAMIVTVESLRISKTAEVYQVSSPPNSRQLWIPAIPKLQRTKEVYGVPHKSSG